jgi:hypothetical protein
MASDVLIDWQTWFIRWEQRIARMKRWPAFERAAKWMNAPPQKATQGWRWALIAAEVMVAGYYAASISAGRSVRLDVGVPLSVIIFAAWLFLLFGSPFLVRSQKWLAILGWCIAVGAFLFPAL